MATRIFCFIIAIAFLLSVVGFSGFWIYQSFTGEDNVPLTAEERDDEKRASLPDLGLLEDFEPLTDPVAELDVEDRDAGAGEQTVIVGDNLTFRFQMALAESGQIFLTGRPISAPADGEEVDEEAITIGVPALKSAWQDNLVGQKIGSQRRVLIPNADIADFLPITQGIDVLNTSADILPADVDLVLDIEIVGISERATLDDFEPLTEALTELRTEDLQVGDGDTVVAASKVTVNYTGVLARTGTIFDSGEDVEFPLDGVIEGFREGLVGMRVGGKRRLFIPAEQGYGATGAATIPPNADLVFDVEMVGVEASDE